MGFANVDFVLRKKSDDRPASSTIGHGVTPHATRRFAWLARPKAMRPVNALPIFAPVFSTAQKWTTSPAQKQNTEKNALVACLLPDCDSLIPESNA